MANILRGSVHDHGVTTVLATTNTTKAITRAAMHNVQAELHAAKLVQ